MTSSLPISKIQIDGGTQSRAALSDDVVADYASIIRDGADFPPVIVFNDGKKYWLADGFHRLAAYQAAGAEELPVAVHQGNRREAILFSVGANALHGLRRTDDDKRRAVSVLLGDKEWSRWSDRQIAKQCGVSHPFVARVREGHTGNVTSMERTFTHPKTGQPTTMNVGNIGRAASAERKILPEVLDLIRGTKLDNDSYLDKLNGLPGNEQFTAAKRDVAFERQRDRDAEREEGERQRQEARDAQPDEIKQAAQRRTAGAGAAADDLAAVQAQVEELREANAALEADKAALTNKVDQFEHMRVQFEQGGFEKVIADKDEEIRILLTRVETESRDKASYLRSAEFWKAEAKRLGYDDEDVIPLGAASHG